MERSSARGASGGRKWAVELCDSAPSSSIRDVPDPLGYSRTSLELEESAPGKAKKEIDANFKQAKAWETAQAPFKNLFMIGFMMWMAGLGLGLWKLNSLGLLPTHASDWVSTLAPPTNVEFSGGGVPLS
ncbi:hypothetical protein AXG93_1024s1110 [Marchantia polymorpha subsp. ruderalis]|uniref:ER membrane protein complex subunit 4 n=1 Tax=Marchantia polymorpha subsp. ruderalis TaxID=1480154 RepID=A0A176VPL1_MARPO|nr:hypothetical protein AXG93_1024s1110 [Marchantia polymorpha subsp. ruderalis]